MRKPKISVLIVALFTMAWQSTYAQVITFGPTSPAALAESVHTCYGDGQFSITFSNSSLALSSPSIEIQLNQGVFYNPTSFSFSASVGAVITEGDLSDLNRPEFLIDTLAPGEIITLDIGRSGSCEARQLKINGNTFRDSCFVFENGVEVGYSNGVDQGVATYDLVYASLSITNILNSPNPINIGGTSLRSLEITNGSFGDIDSFYVADITATGNLNYSNFVINPSGINYSIPMSNITNVGDSTIILFTAADIAAIDGSGATVGDGDGIFELDEKFILQYTLAPIACGLANTINTSLSAWWGCGEICQTTNNNTAISIGNATPTISISNTLKSELDFCQKALYRAKLTNTSNASTPVGGNFAKDVTVFIGMRHNESLISTLNNMTMWSPDYNGSRAFSDFTINDSTVVLPTTTGIHGLPVSYIKPDHFTTDIDGPGGLEDLDNDGYYDDLARDSSIEFTFQVAIDPFDNTCGIGRKDYLNWEHISADISWYNQCGVLMTPLRQEFHYKNFIRDYNNSTHIYGPTDVGDDDLFEAGIKAHMYNGVNCNGESGYTGSDVTWTVRAILPPGIIPDPAYDPSKFTVSGDTIYTTGTYAFEFTDFPLEADCSSWNNVNPVLINFQTMYTCENSSDSICFEQDIHCTNLGIVMHCGTSCTGVEALDFSTDRMSGSWTNSSKTTLVNIEDADIERNIVYGLDTVRFTAKGAMVDTMSENLYLRITYSPQSDQDIFNYVGGEITIIDIDGQYNSGTTNYTFPISNSPTVDTISTGNYEMLFDLSSYRTSIDANYKYGQSILGVPNFDNDSIFVSALFTIDPDYPRGTIYDVEDFRSYFYLMNNGQEVNCTSWGSQLQYNSTGLTLSSIDRFSDGCNSFNQRFYLSHRSNTGDDHPSEYRPQIHIDSAYITIPPGFELGEVDFFGGTLMNSSDYSLSGSLLKVYRPSGYSDYDKRTTFYPNIELELIPNCEAPEGISNFDVVYYYKDYAYATDASLHFEKVHSANAIGTINYTKPNFTILPQQGNKEIYEDQVSWTVDLCNSSSSSDIDFNWLILDAPSGLITIDSVHDITSGTPVQLSTTLRTDGSYYAEVGELKVSECSNFEIFATYNNCAPDSLNIMQGWSCGAYPSAEAAPSCAASGTVYVKNKSGQISTTISALSNTPTDPSNPAAGNWNANSVNMCEPFPSEIRVVNAQPGYLYDVSMEINIPSGGLGLNYVPGSATIELEGVDMLNTPRPIGALAEAALVAASNGNLTTWTVSLAELDPTNFGADEPLPGTDFVNKNEFILRWRNETTCDLSSGDNFTSSTQAQEYCGAAAEGSGEKVQGFPININGVVPAYFTNMSGSIAPDGDYNGCSDTKTFTMDLFISGGVTQTTDTVVVTLAEGLSYDHGFVCNNGVCPTFVSANKIGNQEEVRFAYSAGQSGNINFTFDIASGDRGSCSNSDIIAYKSENVLPGIACGMGTCPSVKAVTGTGSGSVSLSKPDLDISFLNLEYTGPLANPTYEYELELSNTGIATETDVVIDFYCLNAAGDDIEGGILASDTLKTILGNNQVTNLTGSFTTSCNPANGVAALISPEYDNCYCGSLPSLADKGPGLGEVKHAKMSNVPLPVSFSNISAKAKACLVIIEWSTASETNNDYFIVEKSIDGRNFYAIHTEAGAGNTTSLNSYQYIDDGRNSSNHLYYRIRQVDFDGASTVSEALEVLRSNCNEAQNELKVLPNLIAEGSGAIDLVFYNNSGYESAQVQIFTYTGQLLFERDAIPLGLDSNKILLETDNWPGGTYQVLLLPKKGKPYMSRFVIVE